MTHDRALPDDIRTLIEGDIDGKLTRDEIQQLQQQVLADDDILRDYLDCLELHTELYLWTRESIAFPNCLAAIEKARKAEGGRQKAEGADQESEARHQNSTLAATHVSRKSLLNWASRHPKGPAVAIAATLLVAALVVMGLVPVKEWVAGGNANPEEQEIGEKEEFVARLSNWRNDAWLDDTRPPLDDPRLKIGRRLKIESGLIEVTYLTGVRVVIEGPAEFYVGRMKDEGATEPAERLARKQGTDAEHARKKSGRGSLVRSTGEGGSLDAANAGFLRLGKLVAHVEGEKAQGFTINTPSGRVEDLGTEFGVEVLESGAAEFVVLAGEVDVVRESSPGVVAERVRLVKGEAAFVNRDTRKIARVASPKKIADKFITALPEATISYVGADTATNADWRTTTTVKPLDIDGDNVYGTAGYYIPLTSDPAGTEASSLPAGLTVTDLGVNFVLEGYISYDDATLAPGPTVADTLSGYFGYSNIGRGPNDYIEITLSRDLSFRLGVIADTGDKAEISPAAIKVLQTVGGAADTGFQSAAADRDVDVDYYLFDISGNAGDVFRIRGTLGGDKSNAIGGVFFDLPVTDQSNNPDAQEIVEP